MDPIDFFLAETVQPNGKSAVVVGTSLDEVMKWPQVDPEVIMLSANTPEEAVDIYRVQSGSGSAAVYL